MKELKLHELVKGMGFKSVKEAASLSGRATRTLSFMYINNPDLLNSILKVALEKKG